MNERIKQLVQEAGATVMERSGWTDFGTLDLDVEKFAELIVQECINTLEFHGFGDAIPYVKWMATNKLGQHFGLQP